MRKILALFLIVALCFALVACTVSKEDLVGDWKNTITEPQGDEFERYLNFSNDGTYLFYLYRNGYLYEKETGTYIIDGKKVELHSDIEGGGTGYYWYKNGNLYHGDLEFIKY